MASASRATGNTTSSMTTAVPDGRMPPTDGNRPLRSFQCCSRSARSRGEARRAPAGGTGARAAAARATAASSAASSASRNSTSSAAVRSPIGNGYAPVAGLRAQRRRVHDLQRRRPRGDQRRHRRARLRAGRAKKRSAVARAGRLGHRAQGHLGQEAERALRADHQAGQDLRRRVVVEEGVEAVAGGVLAREPVADAARPARRRARTSSRSASEARRAGRAGPRRRRSSAPGRDGVHHRAVGEHDHRRLQRVVAVLDHAAAHPGGVVGDDAAHHRGVDGGRIGAQAVPEARPARRLM